VTVAVEMFLVYKYFIDIPKSHIIHRNLVLCGVRFAQLLSFFVMFCVSFLTFSHFFFMSFCASPRLRITSFDYSFRFFKLFLVYKYFIDIPKSHIIHRNLPYCLGPDELCI
jgi:hypothetical protein